MPPARRVFLLRCADKRVVAQSQRLGLWPVGSGDVADRLNAALKGGEVVLVFTVSMSGHFQGAARMASPVTAEAAETVRGWGGTELACGLDWVQRGELPYSEAEHLINPLSDPPQPVRAGKDGTEIDPKVAEELLGLLAKAAANPKRSPTPAPGEDGGAAGDAAGGAGGSRQQQQQQQAAAAGMGAAGVAGGMPTMAGAGLMGMHDPTAFLGMGGMGGMNPMMAMGMMNPMMAAGMINPAAMMNAAAMMMMGGMPGMMAAGMRPGGMPGAGALGMPGVPPGMKAESGAGAAAADRSGGGPGGIKNEPPTGGSLRDGPPPGFEGLSGRADGRYGGRDERYNHPRGGPDWEHERGRFDPRFEGPPGRGGPPFREGPPHREGPPFGFRDGPPFRDGRPPFDRFHDRGPPGRPGYGPPPPHLARDAYGPPSRDRDFGPPAGPGGAAPPPRGQQQGGGAPLDDRPDILAMTYEQYLARFKQLKEVQGGPTATATGSGGGDGKPGAAPAEGLPSEGKENAGAAPAAGGAAVAVTGGDAAEAAAPAGVPNVQLMEEDEYVEYCERFSAQMGMPFDVGMVRQHYRTMKAAVTAQQQQEREQEQQQVQGGAGETAAAAAT